MNYKKIHDALISRARSHKLERLGMHYLGFYSFEKHHVLPRSHGGGDEEDNLVPLTRREHLIVHLLLSKMYPECPHMATAAFFMSNYQSRRITGRAYELLRERFIGTMRGTRNHQSKLARVRCTKTGRFVASGVCLTEWSRANGYSITGSRKSATGQQKTFNKGKLTAEFM